MQLKKALMGAGAAALMFGTVAAPALAASTIVVTGDTSAGENQPGWMFNRDTSTMTPYEFNSDQASIGTGALYVKPISATSSDKFVAENFINAPVADVDSISYDFRIGTAGANSDSGDEEQFYMNVYANFGVSNDLKFYDCRYNVVPTVGSTTDWTTVTFDPSQAYDVTTSGSSPLACPAVPDVMSTLSPGSNIRAFSISVGDTSASDAGIDGYLDNVVVSMGTTTTTYDFEPAPAADTTAPAVPTHISPADGTSATTASQNLIDWSDVTDPSSPVSYYYEASNSSSVDANGAFVSPIYQSGALSASEIATPGTPEGTYYWHVRAVDAANNSSAWSTPWQLIIDNTPTPPASVVPTAKEQCMNGGWMTLKDAEVAGKSFKNQGDCVSFVATKGKNKGAGN